MRGLTLPPDEVALRALRAGDELLLTGIAVTLRDAALRRVLECVEEGRELPFEIAGQLVFHCGPCPPGAGRPCSAIGPTTAARMDRYLPLLFELGVKATLGKGPRGGDAPPLHERYGAVYLAAVGGLGALMGGMVEGIETVAWEELGPEAVHRVSLRELPATVAIDSCGRDFLAGQHALYSGPGR